MLLTYCAKERVELLVQKAVLKNRIVDSHLFRVAIHDQGFDLMHFSSGAKITNVN
jgi:hypothetical protein